MVEQEQATPVSFLQGLRSLLQFHQTLGISHYPLDENVRHFLKMTAPSALCRERSRPENASVAPASMIRTEEEVPGSEVLESLPEEVRRCALCRFAAISPGRVPGRGQAGSRLMVVGDWSHQTPGCSPATLFGPEEDIMLGKMMEAIGLCQEDIYVSNILKCCPGNETVDQGCCQSCFSYLLREIVAVRPLLICAMGELAVSMLLGSSEPLSRLRGRFVLYRYQTSQSIPVMPTFHPRYLLSNPEMKMATWKDLQAIRRRLANVK